MTVRTDESGFTAVEWAIGLGLIVLPLVIAVMSVAPVADRLSTARTIAQEAARALALADDWDSGAIAAREVAQQVARNHGLDGAEWCAGAAESCEGLELWGSSPGVLARGGEVHVTVRVSAPAVTVPFLGEFASITLTGTHAERVDDFRSLPSDRP